MSHLNKSDLIRLMTSLGCFDAVTENSENCSKFKNMMSNISAAVHTGVKQHTISALPESLKGFTISFYVLAMLLNSLLLLLLYKDPLKRLRNPSSFLISSLAIADLSAAFFSFVMKFHKNNINPTYADDILPWLVTASCQCSFLTVIFVAFDRYLAVAYPFNYRAMIRPKRTMVVIIFSWLTSSSLSALLFFVPSIEQRLTGTEVYAINIFFLSSVIVVLFPLTHASFRRQRRQLVSQNPTNQRLRREKMKTERNLANTMFLVALSLILFTSPYLAMYLFSVTKCTSCILNKYFLDIWSYYRVFFALHFGTNPIIYAWRLPSYRESLKKFFSPMRSRSRHPRNKSGPTVATVTATSQNL